MGRDEVIATLRQHEPELKKLGIESLALFGSVARGEQRPDSDIDLVVVFDAGALVSLLDLSRVKSTLAEMLEAPVDVTVAPIEKARLKSSIEEDLVRAF